MKFKYLILNASVALRNWLDMLYEVCYSMKMECLIALRRSYRMLQIEIHSSNLKKEVNALIDSGLYPDSHAVIIDALENLVQVKKASRLDAALRSYQEGEVTLGRAAELAGMSLFEFEGVLKARGILKVVEVDSQEELKAGVSLIKNLHRSDERPEES